MARRPAAVPTPRRGIGYASHEQPRRALRRLGAVCGLLASGAVAAAYFAVVVHVIVDTHIGHVVQDGVDTGDMLALPPLLMSLVSILFAAVFFDAVCRLSPRRVRSRR